MRASLSDSLEYIVGAVGNRLDLPARDVRLALDAMRQHRVVPGVFGLYYKLVVAVRRGAYDQASGLLGRILAAAEAVPGFTINIYTDSSLGADRLLFGDLIDPDPGASPWICSPEGMAGFDRRVTQSLGLIAEADAALADELRGLIIQVVGALPGQGTAARPFGSASSFMLWGLLIVNMERYRTAADLIQGLVHEAAHLLLFAHSIEEPLVTNAIEERYTSPLRSDPRPMDGVFHATFVSARVHWVNRKLREATSAHFEPVAPGELDSRLAMLRDLYFGGLATVREHAKLTRTGRQILEESLDYMKAV